MTSIAIRTGPIPFRLELGEALELSDAELLELCGRNPELRIERSAEGDLEVMTPSGSESAHRNAEVLTALMIWAKQDGTGEVFDSSGGFSLPDGAVRAPDASWVLRSRLDALPAGARKGFLPLCPDFVVEVRSPSDTLPLLRAKMDELRANGARLGWLIDPEERTVEIYRPGSEPEHLRAPDSIRGDPELPGFELDLRPVWEPL
ncbi:MAG: Uma2 family endonuclease [Acidobacteriota bacterium]|jgi:Uma2 family endonuclease